MKSPLLNSASRLKPLLQTVDRTNADEVFSLAKIAKKAKKGH